jgi:hypothetical protein
MRKVNTTLCHHLYHITIAELISDVPANAQNDDRGLEVAAVK